MEEQGNSRRARRAGIILGLGLGGFVDGIILHQVLQWHHMLSSAVPPTTIAGMRANVIWDGFFHILTWLLTAIGLALLWSAARRGDSLPSTRKFVALLLLGFGLFNLVEGSINHFILGIHHVREGPDAFAWDLGFLVIGGVLLMAFAWWLLQQPERGKIVSQ